MEPFRNLSSLACPLPLANVDTDQIVPARFLRRTRAEGYGPALFHDLRRGAHGELRPGFPLDDPRWAGAGILVSRRNFGAGSSREGAVYAVWDHGIRCVVAPSFGDIFAGNAVNNGLVPVCVSETDAEDLIAFLQTGAHELTIDLERQIVRGGNREIPFAIDPVWRTKLLNGWDDLDLTLSHGQAIAAFATRDRVLRPWAVPR